MPRFLIKSKTGWMDPWTRREGAEEIKEEKYDNELK